MQCKIAELIVDVPEVGGLAPYFREYLYESNEPVDIQLNAKLFDRTLYNGNLNDYQFAYMESGRHFFSKLLHYSGFYLHASSVAFEGKGYLFSAKSGTGKSTHTHLWQKLFGSDVSVFNDDKTPLRRIDGVWYAYGAPWCGKDHINQNVKVPIGGICFLKQAKENRIRRLDAGEALTKILNQTIRGFPDEFRLDLLLTSVDMLLREVPVFELENRPEPAAAILSYETMKKAAEEMGL